MNMLNQKNGKACGGRLAVLTLLFIALVMASITPVFAANGTHNGNDTDSNDYNGWGWLTVTNLCGITEAPMIDSHFAIYRQSDGQVLVMFATDEQGKSEPIFLPAGDYILEQLLVQDGYALVPYLHVRIIQGINLEKTIFNYPATPTPSPEPPTPSLAPSPAPSPEPTPTPLPDPEPMGRLLLTKRAQGTGRLLPGAVFEVRRHMDDSLVSTVITDSFGEAALDLPIGDYFLREIQAPEGFVLNPARIPFRITQGRVTPVNVTNSPLPDAADPPQEQPPGHGRLLVTSSAQGSGELVQGVVFEVRRAMDDVFVAQIVTNRFGEAALNLAIGDYFLREVSVPGGFAVNPARVSVRIQGNRITEINATHERITAGQGNQAVTDAPGRLLIINRAQAAPGSRGQTGTGANLGAPLANTLFEVRSVMDDRLVAQLQTNQFGEAAVNLPAGDYFIRQMVPAAGFILDSSRTNIRIVAGELLTVTVISMAIESSDESADADAPAYGRLLVTLMSGATGERISNGVISVHDVMTDRLIVTLTSDFFGEASVFLPAGRYFMRQSAMPQGYLVNFDRIPFTINAGDMTDMALAVRAIPLSAPTPTPAPASQPAASSAQAAPPAATETVPGSGEDAQGKIEILTRAAGSGNPLSGGIFAVYRADDSRRMAELTTGADGRAYFMAQPGMYFVRELRPTFGFTLEHQRIFLEVGEGETVILELTKERDYSIAYLPADADGGGIIYIPPTGQDMSLVSYMGGGLFILIAIISGGMALWEISLKKWAHEKGFLQDKDATDSAKHIKRPRRRAYSG